MADILTLLALIWVMAVFGRMWFNTLPGSARRAMRGGGGGTLGVITVGVFFRLLDLSVQIVAWLWRAVIVPLLRVCGRGVARAMNIGTEKIAQSNRTPRRTPPGSSDRPWWKEEPGPPQTDAARRMAKRVEELQRQGDVQRPPPASGNVAEIQHATELQRVLLNVLGVFGEDPEVGSQALRGSTITPADVDTAEETLGAAYAVSFLPPDPDDDDRPGLLIQRVLWDDDDAEPFDRDERH